MFTIFEPNDPRLSPVSFGLGKQRGYAGVALTHVTRYAEAHAVRTVEATQVIGEKQRQENIEMLIRFSKELWLKTGIDLKTLDLREQARIAETCLPLSDERKKKLFAAVKDCGIEALRVFVSFSSDPRKRDKIVHLHSELGPPAAREIYRKYAEVMEIASQSTAELERNLQSGAKLTDEQTLRIREELMRRANDMVTQFTSRLEQAKKGGKRVAWQELVRDLERIEGDTLVFAGMFKALFKGKTDVEFEHLRGIEVESTEPWKLSAGDRARMLQISEENWKEQIPTAAAFVYRGLEKKLQPSNDQSTFELMRKDGKIISFLRFDERPDLGSNAMYAGSLNVASEYRGSAIGEALLRSAVDQMAKAYVVYADFFPEVAAGRMYIERMGWIVTGTEEVQLDDRGTTKRRLLMKRDDRENARYRSRSAYVTSAELMRWMSEGGHEGIQVRRFRMPEESERFLDTVERATASGLVLTRYIADEHDPQSCYVAFEPRVSAASAPAPLKRAA